MTNNEWNSGIHKLNDPNYNEIHHKMKLDNPNYNTNHSLTPIIVHKITSKDPLHPKSPQISPKKSAKPSFFGFFTLLWPVLRQFGAWFTGQSPAASLLWPAFRPAAGLWPTFRPSAGPRHPFGGSGAEPRGVVHRPSVGKKPTFGGCATSLWVFCRPKAGGVNQGVALRGGSAPSNVQPEPERLRLNVGSDARFFLFYLHAGPPARV